MSNNADAMNELHWLIDMVQTIEVGLVVLDNQFNIQLWNGFMENHSSVSPNSIKGKNIFKEFPDLPENWLKQKIESVFMLKNRAFISWEQRPYIFKFKNYRPITGRADHMYQNVTILPLASLTGQVTHVSLIIYDVTDTVVNNLQIETANLQLERLSQTDELTQLNNRRHWQICMQREFDRFERYGNASSLIMFDIDNFKRINDQYGHMAGDRVIQHIAHLLTKSLRETDCAGRYGGEEFAIVLSDTGPQEAMNFTERLRKNIANSSVIFEGKSITFTISLGISGLEKHTENSSSWLSQADKALYQAKEKGRNCSIIYDASTDESAS